MKPQYNNLLLSSSLLWLDNLLVNEGEAYYNMPIRFVPVPSNFKDVYFYTSPYKQLCYDFGVTGTNISTGVFLNGNYINPGTSGFIGINFEEGAVMFNSGVNNAVLTGYYPVKEFCVKTIAEPEELLLFERKYYRKNQILRATGNLTNEQPLPVIYLRLERQTNEEYCLGGDKASNRSIVVTILAESQYQLDAVKSLITDQTHCYIPILSQNELPFDNYYRLKGPFTYSGITYDRIITGQAAYIKEINSYNFDSNLMSEIRKQNSDVYAGIMEIETEIIRIP